MRRNFLILQTLAFFLWFLGTSSVAAQEADHQITDEISRLQQSLQSAPIADPDLAPIASSASQNLKDASAALASNRPFLSLEILLRAEDLLRGARAAADKAEGVKSGYSSYEAEWKVVSQRLIKANTESLGKDWSRSPLALRALVETAIGRTNPLLDGGRGFALSTKPADGLLYLGEAEGQSAFATFASQLAFVAKGKAIPLRSFLPELQRLQAETNAAFQPPRSVQLHERFIALNSTLKLAGELDAQRSYAGALYQYLEATRHFGMLDAKPVDATRQPELKSAIVTALKKFSASGRDDSMAQIFLQRAASQTAHGDGSASTPDEWRSAQVILERVLPAYLAAQKPATKLQLASGKTVQLTLVRWPYT